MIRILTVLLTIAASNASATLITYTDRVSFDTATGITITEDFESFVTETPFHTSTVDLGVFTLSMTGSPPIDFNFIDIAPAQTSESDVNGSNNLRVFTNATSELIFEFDTAINAFSADFRSLNDVRNRTELVVDSTLLSLPVAVASSLPSFFGFTSDTTFTSITFRGIDIDLYGIDNVSYSVPIPATVWLFFSSIVGLLFGIRKKHAK